MESEALCVRVLFFFACHFQHVVTGSMLSNSRGNDCCLEAASKTTARYIASPPLVIAYALAGRADIDFESEPLGVGSDGQTVYLRDIWPQNTESREVQRCTVHPAVVRTVQQRIQSVRPAVNSSA